MLTITPVGFNPKTQNNVTKGTVKFLKKIAPKLVEGGGYSDAEQALRNIAEFNKKSDKLKIKIDSDDNIHDTSFVFNIWAKGKGTRYFEFVDSSIQFMSKDSSTAKDLKNFSEYLNSSDFFEKIDNKLNEESAWEKTLGLKGKMSFYWDTIKDKITDIGDTVRELPETIGDFIWAISKYKKEVGTKKCIQDSIKYVLHLPNNQEEKMQVDNLRDLIYKLFCYSKA